MTGSFKLLAAVFVVTVLLVSIQTQVSAEMFACVDSTGKVQYTNMNISAGCRPLSSRVGITRRPGKSQSIILQPTLFRDRYSQDSSSYDQHIRRTGRLYNVDPSLIKAVIKTESDFDCYALSKAGAQGLMQLMPATARELSVGNPYNPYENIDAGTRYLRDLLDIFDGNVPLSLAAYNAGPTLVKRLQRIPRIPETVRYVKKVLTHYKGYGGYVSQSQIQIASANEK